MEKQMQESLSKLKDGNRIIKYITSLETDNMLLTKEKDALAKESEMKFELNHKLDKALKKVCKRQAAYKFCHGKTKSSEKCRDEEYCANCWEAWANDEG